MKGISSVIATLALSLCLTTPVLAQTQTEIAPDVVSIGSAVTEIVYALDQGARLVARDATSGYPEAARDLPDVGYMRALSPEGVLSLGPELILASEGSGPPETVSVLKASGVEYVEVPGGYDAEAVARKIRIIGEALEVSERAEALATRVSSDLRAAMNAATPIGPKKRVIFIISAAGGKLTAGGQGTGADAIITLAGGVNAVQEISGYKQLSDEAVTAAAPDVVVMMDRGGSHDASANELFAMPALATTPAAQSSSLVRIDGALILGFGPRLPEAVRALNTALYGG